MVVNDPHAAFTERVSFVTEFQSESWIKLLKVVLGQEYVNDDNIFF